MAEAVTMAEAPGGVAPVDEVAPMNNPATSGDLLGLWERALSSISGSVKPHNYDLWLRPIRCTGASDGRIQLQAPNRFVREWFEENYLAVILDVFRAESGREWNVVFEELGTPEPAPNADDQGTRSPAVQRAPPHPTLNPRYLFNRFVAGRSNQLAYSAARAVAETPGLKWNPLFIYGDAGLGKTHLCQAIGHEIHLRSPSMRITFASAERFMNEFISSLGSHSMEEFRHRYRETDVLLIDDIQFFGGKDRTQDEFFFTFEALYEARKQIVLTSDRKPADIQDLTDRLKTRFEQGMIADIVMPDLETKIAILHKKAETDAIALPDDAALVLAQAIRSNVRELEGVLLRVAAIASLSGVPITVDLARQTLATLKRQTAESISVESVQKAVATYYDVKVSEIRGPKRDKRISLPRQVAMYLARRLTAASYPDLGQRFGGKDHSTVISACQKIDRLVHTQSAFRSVVEQLERNIQG